MPNYYVPKKNRCKDGPCMTMPDNLLFATSSSINSSIKSSKTAHTTYDENKDITNVIGKGEGNIRKQGSGGNSYAGYLARKKGATYCNCNVKK